MIFASSREVYGDIHHYITEEQHADFSFTESPYSASKVAGEAFVYSYGRCYDLPYLVDVGIGFDRFMDLGRKSPGDPREPLCTTFVGLRMADNSVGVSRLHGSVSRRLWKDAWPGLPEEQVPIGSVTNGAHMPSWVAPELADLLRRHVAWDWWDLDATDPRWDGIDNVPDEELWEIHCGLKTRLVEFAHELTGDNLDVDALTLGFSRRFAPYKRANLVMTDLKRLTRLLNDPKRPL